MYTQSFKKFQFKHSVWFDRQTRQNFNRFKTTTFYLMLGSIVGKIHI
jgi:hypothetical protein